MKSVTSIATIGLISLLSSTHSLNASSISSSSPSVKVAYIGDTGHGENFQKVLKLIKDEGADIVIHAGDLAYDESNSNAPKLWESQINSILGPAFPYLFAIGNHDVRAWKEKDGYASIYERRLNSNTELKCVGDHGTKSYCSFRGIHFVISGIGSDGGNIDHHVEFIGHALRQTSDAPWRVCVWHKNQTDMQTGKKTNDVGWHAYRLCQKKGAMIATGHEHSYARTMNLNRLGHSSENHGAYGNPSALELTYGSNFVFVNGIGGASLRPVKCGRALKEWWASVFSNNYYLKNKTVQYSECKKEDERETVNPGGPSHYNYGALFITYGQEGNPRLAKAEFKTVEGLVIDEFTITSKL